MRPESLAAEAHVGYRMTGHHRPEAPEGESRRAQATAPGMRAKSTGWEELMVHVQQLRCFLFESCGLRRGGREPAGLLPA